MERDLHQHIAANSESLGDHREQGKRRGLRGERAILKDNPAGRSGLGKFFQKWSSNRIKDHARALASSDLFNARHEVFFLSSDHVVSLQGKQLSFLVALARGRN